MSEAKETLTPPCALPPGEGAGAVTRGSIAASALAFSRSSRYAEGTVRFASLDAAAALRAPRPSRRWRSSSDLARQLLAPFVLRRVKADVLEELQPKLEEELSLPMPAAQRASYRAILAQARARPSYHPHAVT